MGVAFLQPGCKISEKLKRCKTREKFNIGLAFSYSLGCKKILKVEMEDTFSLTSKTNQKKSKMRNNFYTWKPKNNEHPAFPKIRKIIMIYPSN